MSYKPKRAQSSIKQLQIQEMSCLASFDPWKIKGQRPSDPLIIVRGPWKLLDQDGNLGRHPI